MTDPYMISQIIKDVRIHNASFSKLLAWVLINLEPNPEMFDYCSVIQKIDYFEKTKMPNMDYTVHQCAWFLSNPREAQTKAVNNLENYLKVTHDQGIVLMHVRNSSLQTHAGANWCEICNKE